MKSKTERTIDAMDAIYKEVRARKRAKAWRITKTIFSVVFDLALSLVMLYGLAYGLLIKPDPVVAFTLACAMLMLDKTERKRTRLEKELNELKKNYNTEEE